MKPTTSANGCASHGLHVLPEAKERDAPAIPIHASRMAVLSSTWQVWWRRRRRRWRRRWPGRRQIKPDQTNTRHLPGDQGAAEVRFPLDMLVGVGDWVGGCMLGETAEYGV